MIVKTEKHKGYTINVFKQKPSKNKPTTNKQWQKHFESYTGDILGTHKYEILNKKNEIVYALDSDMWDIEACLDHACQDIESFETIKGVK